VLARPALKEDAQGIDRLLAGSENDVRIDRDAVFVIGERGEPTGVLVYRPGAWVHELHCERNRLRAEALANFAVAAARVSGLQTAIFTVKKDNRSMQRFVESLGAVKQDEDTLLYILNPL
jgi:hypothetical protein